MFHAVIRNDSGERNELDLADEPVELDVTFNGDHIQITLEAMWDLAPPHQRRLAVMTLPRDVFDAALRKAERMAGNGTRGAIHALVTND